MRNPKHILITGASSGLGASLALLYAAPGIRLSLHGRNPDRLNAVADSTHKRGADVHTKLGNVADQTMMAAWIEGLDMEQPIDLAIANAGISAGTGGGGESDEQSRAIFDTNLNGVLNTVQPLLPRMMQRGRGQIALMASLAGYLGLPGAPSYMASKAAVKVYGEALRCDAARYGIEVNVICPGFIKTPMTDVNHFPMPFIMDTDKAAALIRDQLITNRARIAFPWPMALLVSIMAALPRGFVDLFAARMPRKSAQK